MLDNFRANVLKMYEDRVWWAWRKNHLKNPKGTAEAPAVDLLMLNNLRDTKTNFYPLKDTTNTPVLFYKGAPPP